MKDLHDSSLYDHLEHHKKTPHATELHSGVTLIKN